MRDRATATSACGLVQVTRLCWDKSARGGQGARDRNAVPDALSVPADELRDLGGLLLVSKSQ